ncbi:hypothetical protein C8J57DRAFT_1249795 [Mycena rebaudengoi]|nr:hypothetical protein C8J57DRAFT_1249795 [Mycena rebaudengoi]
MTYYRAVPRTLPHGIPINHTPYRANLMYCAPYYIFFSTAWRTTQSLRTVSGFAVTVFGRLHLGPRSANLGQKRSQGLMSVLLCGGNPNTKGVDGGGELYSSYKAWNERIFLCSPMWTSFSTCTVILLAFALRSAVAQLSGDQATCLTKCSIDTPLGSCGVGDVQCTCAPASDYRAKVLACGTGTCSIPSASAAIYYDTTCLQSGFDASKVPTKNQTGSADTRGVVGSTILVAAAITLRIPSSSILILTATLRLGLKETVSADY